MSNRNAISRMGRLINALKLETPIRILDIGANPLIEGEVSYKTLLDHQYAEVVGFEPQQDALDALNTRKSAAETYLPYALGDGSDQTLRLFKSPSFSSIYAADMKSAEYLGLKSDMIETSNEPMRTRQLDLVDEVPEVDFVKIDVQGSETTIFEHGRQKLAHACVVQTEVRMFPLYVDEPRYGALDAELNKQGFEFLQFSSLKHVCLARRFRKRLKRSQFAQAVDGDAFFVRDLRKMEAYSTEQLKKLSVIADAVIRSHDLALYALEALLERGVINMSQLDSYFSSIPQENLKG
jgi:FkbM family methyltransferase